MEKGGGGGGGGTSDGYTKTLSKGNSDSQSSQNNSAVDCDNVDIDTTITKPNIIKLEGIEEGNVLSLSFSTRIEIIEILNFQGEVCGYVTSSVKRLFTCYDKGYRFEAILMSRNKNSSFSITIRNKK